MKTLLKNGSVVNVFTDEIEKTNVLICDGIIIGMGDYSDSEADFVEDVSGKIICPGFIDGHIHIESTMLTPKEFAKVCLKHGTTAVIADPHEIANVAGINGINYMLESSEGLPLDVYIMIPSCVPATPFDEAGAVLEAEDILPLYDKPRVLGLGEMMNYPGVLNDAPSVLKKIEDAKRLNKIINGHAPMLRGKPLDKYIAAGISDDHECCDVEEAIECIKKGQIAMIRQGTAAKNLYDLLPVFDEPYSRRCILVTDDRHPADLISEGHVDNIIRLAVEENKSVITAIRMATIQAAQYFNLRDIGAVAPSYKADLLILNDLEKVDVCDVYKNGKKVVCNKEVIDIKTPQISEETRKAVYESFRIDKLKKEDFYIEPQNKRCRVINVIPKQLLTEEWLLELDFENENGISVEKDILKIAVIERYKNSGHKGVGFIHGIGIRSGAVASSVSHDSHNLIVVGTNDEDMAVAANKIIEMGGGNVVVDNGKIVAQMPLAIGGLMSDFDAELVAKQNKEVRNAAQELGADMTIEPFMNMAFISLAVIPSLKMTTHGLIDVDRQKLKPLFEE